MGRSVVKQPNGKYAIFSSYIDDFVLIDATEEELVEELVKEVKAKMEEEVRNTIKILNGAKWTECYPFYTRGEVSWEECEETRKRVHERNKLDK